MKSFLGVMIATVLFCIVVPSAAQERTVKLYPECDFRGVQRSLGPGEYQGYRMGIKNDELSSLEVPRGMRVIIFQDFGFKGNSVVITSDVSCLSREWNNQVSSLIVEQESGYDNYNRYTYDYNRNYQDSGPVVTLFRECDYEGASKELAPGTYYDYELGIGNDELSSILIPRGLEVTLYTDNRLKGEQRTLTTDNRCLTGVWNDAVSSIEVKSRESDYYGGTRDRYREPEEVVTIYSDCNYRGRSQDLGVGRYTTYELRIGNDQMSSIRVPRGMKVTLYTDNNFRGESTVVVRNDRCLADYWNEQVSSIVVDLESSGYESGAGYLNDVVTVFSDCDYRGRSHQLGVGRYRTYELGIENDQMSSIRVPRGMSVTLYTDNNFRGESTVVVQDDRCFSNNWDNQVSSIVVDYSDSGAGYYNNRPTRVESNVDSKMITVYSECDYKGASKQLYPGRYSHKDMQIGNDALSSLRIPKGYSVTIYKDDGLRGESTIITMDTPCLSSRWDNQASSIEIKSKSERR